MTLRVALDVTPELIAATGVARYSRELRQALERRDDCEVAPFAVGRRSQPLPPGVHHIPVPLRVVHAGWRAFRLPRAEQLSGSVDLVHSLDLIPPPSRLPLAITVHDLVSRDLPTLHDRRSRSMQRQQQSALHRAAAVLTVSQATADSVAELGVDRERIHVTPNGSTALPEPRDPPVPPGSFVLAVGTLEPRKGHDVLIRAFAASRLEEVRLVFAGPTVSRDQELRSLADSLGVAEQLIILGEVDDATLAGLYRRATVLCLPSWGEGFGLPVLEALACGLPVVASDLPAIREVTGQAAVLVAPGQVDGFAGALRRMVDDAELRSRLRHAGPGRAAAFNWEATAEATVRAYQTALGATE